MYSFSFSLLPIKAFWLAWVLCIGSGISISASAQGCSQPSNLSATPLTPTSVSVSWAPIQGALSYQVQYRANGTSSWITTAPSAATNRTLTGLLPSTVYSWRVKASCSVYSSIAVFNTGGSGGNASCSQPSNLSATPLTPTSVSVSWSAIQGAFNYQVQYRVSTSGVWITAAPTTTTSFVLTGLLPSTVYSWRVKASCSDYSSEAIFNTGGSGGNASCSQPSNLSATPLTPTSVSVSWSAIQGAFDYQVQYRVSTSGVWITAAPTTTTSFVLTGLLPSTVYSWRVKASCSDYSSEAVFNTGGSGGNASCSQPSNLSAIPLSATSVTLTWSAIQGAFNYQVQYRVSTSGVWITTAATPVTNLTLNGLLPGTAYSWRVKASCSDYSSIAVFNTSGSSGGGGGSTSCSAPSNTNTDAVFPSFAQVSWEPVSGALNYVVQYRAATSTNYITVGTVTSANATITGLSPGREYVWRVKANCSPYGSDVQFSTPFSFGAGSEQETNYNQATNLQLGVFPNPVSSGALQVRAEALGQLQVINQTGQVVLMEQMIDTHHQLEVSNLPAGIYFLRLQTPEARVETTRFVITR